MGEWQSISHVRWYYRCHIMIVRHCSEMVLLEPRRVCNFAAEIAHAGRNKKGL